MLKYFWIACYVLAILLANITLDQFIPMPVYGQLSIGTLFFAVIFTLRDRIHEYGLKAVFLAIALALAVNTAYSVVFNIEARFIMASFVAIAIGELADTFVFQSLKQRNWLVKCLSSNLISVPLDAIFFTFLAFYGLPDFPLPVLFEIIYADVVVKYTIALLVALPIFYTVRGNNGHKIAA